MTIPKWHGESGGVGGVVDAALGAWSTSTPGPTTGRPFNVPAGVLRATVTTTGFSANGATIPLWNQVYIDGVAAGDMLLDVNIPTNQRILLPPAMVVMTITQGTHYWAIKSISGSSAAADRASFYGIILPA